VLTSAVFGCSAGASNDAEPASEEDDLRAAATTLTFPLVAHEYKGNGDWVTLSLDELNPKLQAAGLEPFEKSITVGRDGAAKFEALAARVDAANAKLGREIEFRQDWDPSKYIGLCHTGLVTGVRKTIEALRGSAFPEYMGMPAYRYKNTKKIFNGSESELLDMHRDENSDQVRAWEQFDTASDTFFMFADGGQQGDGTELFAVSIPKCR
jgi:hypothetical protein